MLPAGMTLALVAQFAIVLILMAISVSVLVDKGFLARLFDAYRTPGDRRFSAIIGLAICSVVLVGLILVAVGVFPND
jgi:hypothetical protein